LLKYV